MSKRKHAVAAASIVLAAALMPAIPAHAATAVRVPLIHDPRNNCQRGADAIPGSGTLTHSSVVIRHNGVQLNAQLILVHARPKVTYTVFLIQSDGNPGGPVFDCFTVDAYLTTNASGAGTAKLSDQVLGGVSYVHLYAVSLGAPAPLDRFDTKLIKIS